MKSAKVLQLFVIIIAFNNLLMAQTDPTLEVGFKPYGSYHGGDLDSVSLTNGNLTVHIPVAGYPQRGSLGYTPRITYNNKGWSVVPNCNHTTGICSPYWVWHGAGVNLDMSSENTFGVSWQPASPGSFTLLYSAGTADGSVHQLASNQAGGMTSIDGTAIWYDGTAPANLQPGLTRDRHGNHTAGSGPIEDPNGNLLNSGPSTVIDTLGRNFPAVWTSGADATGCTGPLPIVFAGTYSLPGFNSASRIIKVCQATISLQSNFQASGYYNSTETAITDRSYHSDQIQSIVLYNGVSWATSPAWTFEYSSRNPGDPMTVNYGDLTKITLPTGGTISYTWGTINACDINASTPMSRGVTTRTVDANDGTGPQKWTYSGAVTDPAGNDILHTFTALNNSCSFYETQTQYFQGSYQSGRLLKTVNTDYRWIPNPFDTVNPSNTLRTVTNVFPIRITTTWPNGQVTKVEKDYDSNLVFSVPGQGWITGSYGNVTEVREYGYGSGTPGPLLRRTDYTYKAFDGSPSAASYRAANLLDLISSIAVYDGAGNLVSQTNYGYDEASLQSSGITSQQQHDTTLANPGVRGNRTSESHWLNTTGGMITSTATYYDTGTPYQMTDPGGHTTTNFYGTGFQSGASFLGAYVSQVQNALLQDTFFDYDFATGLRTALKDANGQITSWDYDFLNRTLHANAPNHGSTTWTYNDTQPPTFTASSTITDSIIHIAEGDLDGLGRVAHTKLISDPDGAATVDITYDGLGRTSTVSNPHRSSSAPTDGTTTSIYDGLGRVKQTTRQDGSISTMAFNVATNKRVNATCNIATDEAGKQRGECFDALGRLVEVDEPTGGPVQVNNYATLQQDGNFVVYSSDSNAQWSTKTAGTNASSIFIQDDGNLVLYIFKWSAGTYATPTPGSYPAQSCSIGTYLVINQRINANQCIVSPHGQYMLYMAPDGNFYIYDIAHGTAPWGAGTYSHPGAYAIMQGDGNLCVYTATNTYLWCSGTSGTYAERLNMEDDGRIIIYKSAWNSGTSTGQFNWTALTHPGCDVGTGTGWTGVLAAGSCFVSPNGHFELLMQTDGNLVIYDRSVTPNTALWSTQTTVSPTDPAVAMRTLYAYDTLGNLFCVEQHGTSATGTGCPAAPPGPTDPPVQPDPNNAWRRRLFAYDSLSRLRWASNPESGVITYSYDVDGNLLQKTSPAPNQTGAATQTVSYCYDALHRVTGKGYGAQSCPLATPVVTYAYDSGTNAKGHLTSLTDQAGTASYTYDIMGRLASETRPIAGVSKTTSYTYNLDGSVKTLTYPSNRVVTYAPDSAGRLLSAVDGNGTNYVTSASYNPDGSLKSLLNGSTPTLNQNFQYTPRLQLCRITVLTSGTMPTSCTDSQNIGNIMDRGYDFHAGNGTSGSGTDNGNVFAITNYRDANRSQAFTYDALNRLSSGWSSANTGAYSWGENYSIDAWGNLQISPMGGKAHGGNFQLAGNAQNRPTGLNYDAAGNLLSYLTANYAYDQENRLSSTAGISYTYDGNGERVLKSQVINNVLTPVKRYWSMDGNTLAEGDGSENLTTEYIYFGGKRVARIDLPANTVHYYLSDHLGSTSIVASAAGTIEEESDYYPFGTEVVIIGGINELKFTGKRRDTESQLDYFGARYYSNGLGRFASVDPSKLSIAFSTPQTWNRYSYVYNNPLRLSDDNGKWPTDIHNRIIDASFPTLTPHQRQILKDVSAEQDSILGGGQGNGASYQHAMRGPDQTVEQAQTEFNDFVESSEQSAQNAQMRFWMNDRDANEDHELSDQALADFASALHAILDSTSPAHEGFQVWDWRNPALIVRHHNAEKTINDQQMQRAVSAARNAFNNTFWDYFGITVPNPSPQPNPEPNPKRRTDPPCLKDRKTGGCV